MESAKYRLPEESNASAVGRSSCADFAGPPSPEKPGAPVPAMVAMVPVAEETSRMRWLWLSAIKRSPEESSARPAGESS